MSDRVTQYFRMVSAYRSQTDPLKRKIILEQGLPNLRAGCGSKYLQNSITRFIKEESENGIESNQHAG